MESNDQQQIEMLANRIAKEEYDLIGLQEVNQPIANPAVEPDNYFQPVREQKEIHQKNFLLCLTERLKELGCYYYWSWAYSHIGYDIYHEGIGLLSKTPIKAESHLISESTDPADYHTRNVIIGETIVADQNVIVVSSHFSWWETAETAFAREWSVLEDVLYKKKSPLIILGDFNNDPQKVGEGYELVAKSLLGLQDAFVAAEMKIGENTVEKAIDGWTGNAEKLRIDYVFASKNFKIKSYQTVFDGKNEYTISDHYGIEVAMD